MSRFNKILLFLNIVVLVIIVVVATVFAWTNPSGYPPSGSGAVSFSGGTLTVGGNLTVSGSTVNTCTLVAYTGAGVVACPQYYYVTTGVTPTQAGDMLCCKVSNPQ